MELNEILVAGRPNVNMTQDVVNMNNLQIVEEGLQVLQDGNTNNLPIHDEASQMSQDLNMTDLRIVEEGPRVCPVCSQDIKSYFINYNEKIEMCENLECDYPFAYEPIKIFREENGVQTVEIKSMTGKVSTFRTVSQSSSQCCNDVDKVCDVFEAEDVPGINLDKQTTVFPNPALPKTDAERRKEELLMNVEKIKQMTKSMNEMSKEPKRLIRNEKWIKNLQYLQGLSGSKLLKPAELRKIKKKEISPMGELKIDIDKNNLPSITIEVNRVSAPDAKIV